MKKFRGMYKNITVYTYNKEYHDLYTVHNVIKYFNRDDVIQVIVKL